MWIQSWILQSGAKLFSVFHEYLQFEFYDFSRQIKDGFCICPKNPEFFHILNFLDFLTFYIKSMLDNSKSPFWCVLTNFSGTQDFTDFFPDFSEIFLHIRIFRLFLSKWMLHDAKKRFFDEFYRIFPVSSNMKFVWKVQVSFFRFFILEKIRNI